MSILINKKSKIMIQGFTGKEATFHSNEMINYGSNIICGVTPGKGGIKHLNLPVFNTVNSVISKMKIDVSIIFVPSMYAADSIMESVEEKIKLIICITEGIPIHDMLNVISFIKKKKKSILIGPNCPGVISVKESKAGIMPNSIFNVSGNIGIISRSGTLAYEAVNQIINSGYGISTVVGIGGDPILGSSITDIVKMFINDKKTKVIFIIGEIGGKMEIEAARWLHNNNKKKIIISLIVGITAPVGKVMGHAGAIINKDNETAISKINELKKYNVTIINSFTEIGKILSKFKL